MRQVSCIVACSISRYDSSTIYDKFQECIIRCSDWMLNRGAGATKAGYIFRISGCFWPQQRRKTSNRPNSVSKRRQNGLSKPHLGTWGRSREPTDCSPDDSTSRLGCPSRSLALCPSFFNKQCFLHDLRTRRQRSVLSRYDCRFPGRQLITSLNCPAISTRYVVFGIRRRSARALAVEIKNPHKGKLVAPSIGMAKSDRCAFIAQCYRTQNTVRTPNIILPIPQAMSAVIQWRTTLGCGVWLCSRHLQDLRSSALLPCTKCDC
jgi:hypothetical protein